jgi:hypothetical protein
MTDAELIALAALVNASCTEIQAANMTRQGNGYAMAYQGYQDCFGVDAAAKIRQEIERREQQRYLEQTPCSACGGPIGPTGGTCLPCKKKLCLTCSEVHVHDKKEA